MAVVRLIQGISGLINGVDWPPVGGTIDIPDGVAAELVERGEAEYVIDEPVEEIVVDGDDE